MKIWILGAYTVLTRQLCDLVRSKLPKALVTTINWDHDFLLLKDSGKRPDMIIGDGTCLVRPYYRPDSPLESPFDEPMKFARMLGIPHIRFSKLGSSGPLFRFQLFRLLFGKG